MIATAEKVEARLARRLRAASVGRAFGVSGGQTLPLCVGILETSGIEHVLIREERGAEAKGFGVPAWRVDTPAQLDDTRRAAGSASGPALVEVVTHPSETPELSIAEHRAAPRSEFQGEM